MDIFKAGSSGDGFQGCEITSIIIKAEEETDPGMVRLFFNDKEKGYLLFCEVCVPAVSQTSTKQSFSHEVIMGGSLSIGPDTVISASTDKTQKFAVTIKGSDWSYL